MATIEVDSWNGLVNAAATSSGGDTILLTKDIDCNDEIPLGVEQTLDLGFKTLDGQGHSIRNLRTHVDNPVTIFSGGRMFLTNIDFINLIANNAYLMENDGYNNFITADHCRFVGKRNRPLIAYGGGSISFLAYMQYCFFNVPCTGTADEMLSGSPGKALLGFCWVRDTNDGRFADNAINDKAKVQGSYFDGDLVLNSEQTTVTIGGAGYTPSVQNVYDFDIKSATDISSEEFTFNFNAGLVKNRVRSINNPSVIYTPTITPGTGVILATPEEMTNPQALYNKGFDIVVP